MPSPQFAEDRVGPDRLRCAALTALLLFGHAVAAPVKPSPKGWHDGAVFMEIFVRGYQDSDGDGSGDLRGLIQRLDYLQELGIQGIWLMPITPSADKDHGYATTDYRAIEPQYGSLADFDELMRQAHKRGIAVIIDYVINHSAAAHPLFQQALQGPGSPYRDWFVWQHAAPEGWDIWGKNPWYVTEHGHYFGTFGPHMPDFNLRNPAVVDYHRSSLRFWLNRGPALEYTRDEWAIKSPELGLPNSLRVSALAFGVIAMLGLVFAFALRTVSRKELGAAGSVIGALAVACWLGTGPLQQLGNLNLLIFLVGLVGVCL
uniref:alpha-amylase family glycosyl hydrolase n=1 Tax=Roseateles sp. TaxID=1971397 RepID=UPI00286A269C